MKLLKLFFVFFILASHAHAGIFRKHYKEGSGIIIILNGPSAAGKSTLQKSIQTNFKDPFISLGIDNLFNDVIPDEYGSKVRPKNFDTKLFRYVEAGKDTNGNPVITLRIGPLGQKIVNGMHYAIAAYANQGNNVVVDYILYDKRWLKKLARALDGYRVYFIKVNLPLNVLEKREGARGTSPVGHARSHYFTLHDNVSYDFELDTSKLTADQAAQAVQNFISRTPEPLALTKNLE